MPCGRKARRGPLGLSASKDGAVGARHAWANILCYHALRTMPQALSQTRVVKKLSPGAAGTKRLNQRFGQDLVCVRYRPDREAGLRYTTVEIVVDSGPIATQAEADPLLLVQIGWNETEIRLAACALGATWDKDKRAWRMSKEAIKRLQFGHRLVKK